MNTDRDLNYRLYLQREEGFRRLPISSEYEKYNAVSSGDVEKVKENFVKIGLETGETSSYSDFSIISII